MPLRGIRLGRHAIDVVAREEATVLGALRPDVERHVRQVREGRRPTAAPLRRRPVDAILSDVVVVSAAALRDVAAHLRRITTELRPPALDDLGLAAAIASLAERAEHHRSTDVVIANGILPQIALPGDPRTPADVELAAFRIAQEAIVNAVRHSGASRITIGGHVGPRSVEIVVEDDGEGIDQAKLRRARLEGHLGVASMEQRAHLVSAHLRIGGRPGGGTRVHFLWNPTT